MVRDLVVAPLVFAAFCAGLLLAHSLEPPRPGVPPCVVASAAVAPPRKPAAPETPADRQARLERQARELARWEQEYEYLMEHSRTAARDRRMPPR